MITLALTAIVAYFVGAFYPFPGWFVGTAVWRIVTKALRRLGISKSNPLD
jgi:hypothetical protein